MEDALLGRKGPKFGLHPPAHTVSLVLAFYGGTDFNFLMTHHIHIFKTFIYHFVFPTYQKRLLILKLKGGFDFVIQKRLKIQTSPNKSCVANLYNLLKKNNQRFFWGKSSS